MGFMAMAWFLMRSWVGVGWVRGAGWMARGRDLGVGR